MARSRGSNRQKEQPLQKAKDDNNNNNNNIIFIEVNFGQQQRAVINEGPVYNIHRLPKH